jgi:hypothetical protein
MKRIYDFKLYDISHKLNEAFDDTSKRRLMADLRRYCEESGSDYDAVCKALNIKGAALSNLDKKQIEWLDEKIGNGKWEANDKTGKVDVYGNVNIYAHYGSKITEIPYGIKLGVVNGDFSLNNHSIESFKTMPDEITGSLYLRGNDIKSLDGMPTVGRTIDLSSNPLESLEGCQQVVNGDFAISNCTLSNLAGAPNKIVGTFNCSDNLLSSLEGGPDEVGLSYNCSNNKLRTLNGFPQEFGFSGGSDVNVSNNQLYTLENIPVSKYVSITAKSNLYPESMLKEMYGQARMYGSWAAAYLWLLTTEKFQRMSKAQRDPIRDLLASGYLKDKSIGLAKVWKSDLMENPAIKRLMRKVQLDSDKDFKDSADLGSDLDAIGF